MHTHTIFILERKEGETGKQRERQRESVRVWEHCGKKELGVCHKTDRWEKPSDQFLG
jgi:hypothetical protein